MFVTMGRSIWIVPLIGFLSFKASFARDFPSPDNSLVAIVSPIKDHKGGESEVRIQSHSGKLLCAKSYGSPDGQQGEIVDQAKWTPDSQFFVFSTYSSGGHQPWYSPVQFYSRSRNRIFLIDGDGLVTTDAHFKLFSPSFIEVFGHSNSVPNDTWIRLNLVKAP